MKTETVDSLVRKWNRAAADSRNEASMIRKTIKAETDAEERCIVRAAIWEECACELQLAYESELP